MIYRIVHASAVSLVIVSSCIIIGAAGRQVAAQQQSPTFNQLIVPPGGTPSPPAPPSQAVPTQPTLTAPLRTFGNIRVYEGESFVGGSLGGYNRGPVIAQNMSGFGPGWSSNAQLFWRAVWHANTDTIRLPIHSAVGAGSYRVTLFYTTAPDYGRFLMKVFYLDAPNTGGKFNETQTLRVDGYAPQVRPPQAAQVTVPSTDGFMWLEVRVPDKSTQSSNYFVGIDRIVVERL